MSKAITLAKFTLVFVIIAGGFSLIIGSLMGGGMSRGYDALKGLNTDPRSIFVQAVLIETNANTVQPAALPAPGVQLTDAAFTDLLTQADRLRGEDGARIRTPALLVQHAETGSITIKLSDRTFDAVVSPSVIDTKHGPVLRVAIQIQRTDTDSAATPRELTFATAYTTAPGNTVVLDLADLGLPGTRAVLALRTTLIDHTPKAAN